MSIRSIGAFKYAVCDECKLESQYALAEGVRYKEDVLNLALPAGWSHRHERAIGGAWNRVQRDYCPRCSIRPECRPTASQ